MAVSRRANLSRRGWDPRNAPQGPFELDRSHPLARGLTAFYMPFAGGLQDVAGGGIALAPGSASVIQSGPRGTEAASVAVNSNYSAFSAATLIGSTVGSIFCLIHQLTTGITVHNPAPIGLYPNNGDGAPYLSFGLNYFNSSGKIGVSWNHGGNYASITTGTPVPTAGTIVDIAATLNTNGNANAYINGTPGATASGGTGDTIQVGSNIIFAGGSSYSSDYTGAGLVCGGFYNRELSAGESAWRAAEPFAMFRPLVRRSYLRVSAVSASRRSLLMGVSA